MLVSSLDQMEKIVKANRNLYWDGWDAVFSYPSDKGRTSKFGARVKDVWHLQRRIPLTEQGWHVPQKYVR
jgi:hypothetical protein